LFCTRCSFMMLYFGAPWSTGTAEPKVVTFCTQVGYNNSSNRRTYHPQKWRGYFHVIFLNFAICHDAARRTGFFTFGVAFHFFVVGNRRHFKLGMWIEHSKSHPTADKPSLKWVWSRHMTHFKFLVSLRYLWTGLS